MPQEPEQKKNRRFRRGSQEPAAPAQQPVDRSLQYRTPTNIMQQYGGSQSGAMGSAGEMHPIEDLASSFAEGASLGFIPKDVGWKWLSTIGRDPGDPRNRPEYWDGLKYRLQNSGLRGRTQETLSVGFSMAGMAIPMILESLVMRKLGMSGNMKKQLDRVKALRSQGKVAEAAAMEKQVLSNMHISRKVLTGTPGPEAGLAGQIAIEGAHSHALLTADTALRELAKEITPLSELTEEEKMYLLANPDSIIKGQKYDPAVKDFGWVQADGSMTHNKLEGTLAAMGHHQVPTSILSFGGTILRKMLGGAHSMVAQRAENTMKGSFFDKQAIKGVPQETIEKQWAFIKASPTYNAKVMNEVYKHKGLAAGEYANSLALGVAATYASEPDATAADLVFGGLGFMLGHFGSKAVTSKAFPRMKLTPKEAEKVEKIFDEQMKEWNEVLEKEDAPAAEEAVRRGASEAGLAPDLAQQFVSKHEQVFKEMDLEVAQKYIDTMFKDSPGEQKLAAEALKRAHRSEDASDWTVEQAQAGKAKRAAEAPKEEAKETGLEEAVNLKLRQEGTPAKKPDATKRAESRRGQGSSEKPAPVRFEERKHDIDTEGRPSLDKMTRKHISFALTESERLSQPSALKKDGGLRKAAGGMKGSDIADFQDSMRRLSQKLLAKARDLGREPAPVMLDKAKGEAMVVVQAPGGSVGGGAVVNVTVPPELAKKLGIGNGSKAVTFKETFPDAGRIRRAVKYFGGKGKVFVPAIERNGKLSYAVPTDTPFLSGEGPFVSRMLRNLAEQKYQDFKDPAIAGAAKKWRDGAQYKSKPTKHEVEHFHSRAAAAGKEIPKDAEVTKRTQIKANYKPQTKEVWYKAVTHLDAAGYGFQMEGKQRSIKLDSKQFESIAAQAGVRPRQMTLEAMSTGRNVQDGRKINRLKEALKRAKERGNEELAEKTEKKLERELKKPKNRDEAEFVGKPFELVASSAKLANKAGLDNLVEFFKAKGVLHSRDADLRAMLSGELSRVGQRFRGALARSGSVSNMVEKMAVRVRKALRAANGDADLAKKNVLKVVGKMLDMKGGGAESVIRQVTGKEGRMDTQVEIRVAGKEPFEHTLIKKGYELTLTYDGKALVVTAGTPKGGEPIDGVRLYTYTYNMGREMGLFPGETVQHLGMPASMMRNILKGFEAEMKRRAYSATQASGLGGAMEVRLTTGELVFSSERPGQQDARRYGRIMERVKKRAMEITSGSKSKPARLADVFKMSDKKGRELQEFVWKAVKEDMGLKSDDLKDQVLTDMYNMVQDVQVNARGDIKVRLSPVEGHRSMKLVTEEGKAAKAALDKVKARQKEQGLTGQQKALLTLDRSTKEANLKALRNEAKQIAHLSGREEAVARAVMAALGRRATKKEVKSLSELFITETEKKKIDEPGGREAWNQLGIPVNSPKGRRSVSETVARSSAQAESVKSRLNRMAFSRMAELPDEPLKDQLTHLYYLGPKALLQSLHETAMMAGGVIPMVRGRNIVDFGISVEALERQLSVTLRTKQDGTPLPKDRKNKGTLRGFMRLDPAVAERLGLDSKSKEDLKAAGLTKTQGGTYMMDMDVVWGKLSKQDVTKMWREGKSQIVDLAHPKHLLQDVVSLEAMLLGDIEGGRFGEWGEAITKMTVGNKAERERLLRDPNASKHSAKALRAFTKQMVIMARAKQLAEAGMLHVRDWVRRPGGVEEVSMLEKLEAAMNRGTMKKLSNPETTLTSGERASLDLGRVLVEYAAGAGSKNRSLSDISRQAVKEFEELARLEKEYGERLRQELNEHAEHREAEPGKFIERDFSTRLRQMEGERLVEISNILKKLVRDPVSGRETLRMLASRKEESQSAVRRRLISAGVEEGQIQDIQTVARAYVMADALANVANSKVVEHRLGFSPAFRAGKAGAPLSEYVRAPRSLDEVHDGRIGWFKEVGKAPEPVFEKEGKVSPQEVEYLAEQYDGGLTALTHYGRFLPKHIDAMEARYAAEQAANPARSRQSFLEEQLGSAHMVGDIVGELHKKSPSAAAQLLQVAEFAINRKAGRMERSELSEILAEEMRFMADEAHVKRAIEDAFGGMPTAERLKGHSDFSEVQRAARQVDSYYTVSRAMEQSSAKGKDRAFWAAQRLQRAGKDIQDMSKALRRELSQTSKEHGRDRLIFEKEGEWYWDYHNMADYMLKMHPEDGLRALLGNDFKGVGCTCETLRTQRRRVRKAMEENVNGKVYAFYGPRAARAWRKTEAYFDSLSGWKGSLGQAFFKTAKDVKQFLLYMREGTAKWGFSDAIENLNPITKELKVRTAEAALRYERELKRFREKHGDELTKEAEFLLTKFYDDNIARSPDPTGTKSWRERNIEHAEKLSRRQAKVEKLVSGKFPELLEALDSIKVVLEVERELGQLASAMEHTEAIRLLGKSGLPLAGKRLSRVLVGPSPRAHLKGKGVAKATGHSLVMAPESFGFWKGRNPNKVESDQLSTIYDMKTGRISDERFLGYAMPITAAHSINSKLNDIHLGAMFKWVQRHHLIPEEQLSEFQASERRFGQEMYVKWGSPQMRGAGAKLAGWAYSRIGIEAENRAKLAKKELRRMLSDPGANSRRISQWRIENARRAEQGKKPLKRPKALKYVPIGGPKGEVAQFLKALEAGYLPRDLAFELQDAVLSASGHNSPKNIVEVAMRRLGGYWAQTKTVLKPKHYVNTLGAAGFLNSFAGGMSVLDFLPYFRRALGDIKKEGRYYKEIEHKVGGKELADHEGTAELLNIMESGVGAVRGSSGGLTEVIERMMTLTDQVADRAWLSRKLTGSYQVITKRAFKMYRNMELAAKLGLYTYHREGGMPKEMAWQKASFATVDPATTPAFLRGINRGDIAGASTSGVGAIKFKTWATRILPTVVESAWKQPVTMAKWAIGASVAQRMLMEAFGYDDEEMADIQAALVREKGLAGHVEGHLFHMPLPKTSTGRFRTLNLWNMAPFQDVSGGFMSPNFQPVTTLAELATGRTTGLYSKELRPEGTTPTEQAIQTAWYGAEQFMPLISELGTMRGLKDLHFTPDKVPAVDEVGAERWLWDTSKALALPVRTWTPSTSLGLGEAHRSLQEEVRFQKARSELVGDSRRRGHIVRRLSGMARNEGMDAVMKRVKKLDPADERYAMSKIREIALFSIKDPTVMKLMAYSGLGVNDYMTAVLEKGGWTGKDVPFLKMLAAYKADGSDSLDLDLYYRFNAEMGRYATRK